MQGINSNHGGFLNSVASALNKPANLASSLSATISHGSHSINSFAAMADRFASQGLSTSLYKAFVKPHVDSAIRQPLMGVEGSLNHARFKLNQTLTKPIRDAEHAVTEPIHYAQHKVNAAFNRASHMISSPFVAAQNIVSSPGNQAGKLMTNAFNHVFSGLGGIENHILKALGGRPI